MPLPAAGAGPPRGTERVLLDVRPGIPFVLTWAGWGVAFSLALGGVVGVWASWREGVLLGLLLAALALGWAGVVALSRRYMLTDRRVSVRLGVFRRVAVEVPIANVQHVAMSRSVAERLLGAGTIAIASAGTDGYALVWRTLSSPEGVLALLRGAMEQKGAGMPHVTPGAPFMVVGLVGGIGAGKSAVAKALGELGFLVVDSDQEAKAALDRPEVRTRLVSWWGSEILDGQGRVDRKRVAGVIFSDGAQRARLEGLIHPLVKATRGELAERARQQGRRGVIVDAPLLFEAGVDQECDFVIFVDAPREQRLERVRARGWDEAELSRRENAQLSLEEKLRRADAVVLNDRSLDDLRARVAQVVEDLTSRQPKSKRQINGPVAT